MWLSIERSALLDSRCLEWCDLGVDTASRASHLIRDGVRSESLYEADLLDWDNDRSFRKRGEAFVGESNESLKRPREDIPD